MPNYIRARIPGGTFFFTLVTERRAKILTEVKARILLRKSITDCRARWPFRIDAIVLLPDHLHAIWSLPSGDADFSIRWAWIKKEFTKSWLSEGGTEQPASESRRHDRRKGVWQRRFWEHCIQDEDDLEHHCDYIHYNPVKHGLVLSPRDWPYSSFHRFVKRGSYPAEWGRSERDVAHLGQLADQAGE